VASLGTLRFSPKQRGELGLQRRVRSGIAPDSLFVSITENQHVLDLVSGMGAGVKRAGTRGAGIIKWSLFSTLRDQVEIEIAIEIEKRCRGSDFDHDFDFDFDFDKISLIFKVVCRESIPPGQGIDQAEFTVPAKASCLR
jgi:hypothetical protein